MNVSVIMRRKTEWSPDEREQLSSALSVVMAGAKKRS
jgi:hypothetical protein